MNYQKLSLLVSETSRDMKDFGFFLQKGNQVELQKGVLRTNCLDNLDRTNAVQSLFAREAIGLQLQSLGLLKSTTILNSPFDLVFKIAWANNGDAISTQYTGTAALKGDFARTGKRNITGLVNDGVNSLARYYLNNFSDGFRQDSYDLFLGNFEVDPAGISPFISSERANTVLVSAAAIIGSLMVVTYFFFPDEPRIIHRLSAAIFWCVTFYVGYAFFGKFVVNKPALITSRSFKSKKV